MQNYWQLQYKRIQRWLIHLGINPKVGLIIILILLFGFLKLFYLKTEFAPYIITYIYGMIVWPLSNKSRNTFLKYTFNSPQYQKIRILENLIMAIPFSAFMIINKISWHFTLPIIFGFILSVFNSGNKSSFIVPTPFAKHPFEFTIGFRKYLPIILLQLVLIVIATTVENYNLAAVTYGSIFLVIMSFYKDMEPYFFVWVHSKTAKSFLNDKLRTCVIYSFMIASIPLIILIIFYPIYTWISILITTIGIGYMVLSLTLKYAQYPFSTNIIYLLIAGISIGIPFLLIITIPFFYFKALQNLRLQLI